MKKILVLILAVFVFTACSKTDSGKEQAYIPDPNQKGMLATDFQYTDMKDNVFRLSEKKGSVVLLFFWRMKCDDCKADMVSLEALHKKYKDKGLIVAAVGADTMHSAPIAEVDEFLKKNHYTFIAMRDNEGFVSEAFGVIQAPESVIIDKNGMIAARIKGKTDWMNAENVKLIEGLLK